MRQVYGLGLDGGLSPHLCDLPEHRLRRGDLVKLVEHHIAPNGSEG